MTNAETLQKYLPCHTTYGDFDLCVECPYNPKPGKIWKYGCAHGQDKMIEDAIALLKEQEPVKPKYTPKSIYSWECGVCAEPFDRIANYCPKCGRAVKWDADGETQVPG